MPITNEQTSIPQPLQVNEIEKIRRIDGSVAYGVGGMVFINPYFYLDGYDIFGNNPPLIKRLELNTINFRFTTSQYFNQVSLPLFLVVKLYKNITDVFFIKDRYIVRRLLNFTLQPSHIYDISINCFNSTNGYGDTNVINDGVGMNYYAYQLSLNSPIVVPEIDTANGDYVEIYLSVYDKNTNTFTFVNFGGERITQYDYEIVQYTAYY